MPQDGADGVLSIALVGADAGLLKGVAATLAAQRAGGVTAIEESIERVASRPELDRASAIIIDLETNRRDSLAALQSLMGRLDGRVPVIVLTDAFDDRLARWFLQLRVADFLRKPVPAKEVAAACLKALRANSDAAETGARVVAFLPAAGGVGNSTLAIETSMLLMREAGRQAVSTCLVDLDFRHGACADYLDLESRLDLDEIGPHPERLDLQLLEVMLSRHASGLSLLAARARPAEQRVIDAAVIVRLLDLVTSRFDTVVIDLPRAWEAWTNEVLVGSNRVYVVTDMTVPGLRLARRLAAALDESGTNVRPRVIVNRFEAKRLFGTGLRRADVERALGGFLAGTIVNNYKLVREAIDRGLPLGEVRAGSNVSADLKKIVLA